MFSTAAGEARLAVRRLLQTPVFTAACVTTLGLAVGLNSAIFSIADAVLFRPLPYSKPDQLHFLRLVDRQTGRSSSMVERALAESLATDGGVITAATFRSGILLSPHAGPDGTESIGNIAVAANFLSLLGVQPVIGRPFDSRDSVQPGRSVILTHASWRDRFGGDPGIVGQSVVISDYRREIVGVLPRDFIFPSEGLSYPFSSPGRPRYEFLTVNVRGRAYDPIVRLGDGVSPKVAEARIESLVRSTAPGLVPRLVEVRPVLFPAGASTLWILMLSAGFVLLLGCANLSHLFRLRVQTRDDEIRLCLALGASRLQIVRAFFCEALIVGLCGALVALFIGFVSFKALQHQVPTALSGGALMGIDWRVSLFTLMLGGASGTLFTAFSASALTAMNLQSSLFSGSSVPFPRRRAVRFGTVALQVGVGVVLVSGAILTTRHLLWLLREPLGFSPENVLTVDAWPTRDTQYTFYTDVVQRLARRSDIESAGAAEMLPFGGWMPRDNIPIAGADALPLVRIVPGYFETTNIKPLRGRLFDDQDSRVADVAVVSQSAAALLFPNQDPLGQHLKSAKGGQFTIVGVVGDVKTNPGRRRDPMVYALVDSAFDGRMNLVARVRDGSSSAPTEIRRLVSGMQRDMPVTVTWWSDGIYGMAEYRTPRFQTMILAIAATLAIALAALGLFGVVSDSAGRRLREVAIRIALGAVPGSIVRILTLQMVGPVVIGLLAGAIGTVLLGRMMTVHLVGFHTSDWSVLVGGAGIIASTAIVSTYLPIRKVSRLPPMTVLKSQ